MKINVKQIKHICCEYDGTKSQLINDIFKDIFKCDIYQKDMLFEFDKNERVLYVKRDISIHGSPYYETVNKITDCCLIDLYFSLMDVYNKLCSYERIKL